MKQRGALKEEKEVISRRRFVHTVTAATAGLGLSSSAKSYSQISGANDRLNFAVIGLHSRAYAHLSALKANEKCARLTHVCDVDSNTLQKFAGAVQKNFGDMPATNKDFRNILAMKDVDAITIATPDHWHTPMAIAGLQAGKHVYVEKPCSHNPAEGALLVEAQRKYGKLVQMGTQRRSSPLFIEAARKIQDGSLVGRAYYAKAWYSNTRKSIGVGKEVPVPAVLDWDLWQGPAPRQAYRDNVQPYNWHWFKIWGTGEALNNGTHEVDVCRWVLGVDYPSRVTASGGRYQYKDDWQFYDTLVTSFEYEDKLISWEGKSCNGMKLYGRDRGSVIVGETGSVVLDAGGYEVYDRKGNKTGEFKEGSAAASSDLTGEDNMTVRHFANFIAAIQTGAKLTQPIESGNITVTMLQLSNIAWEVQRELKLNPKNGHILDDPGAMKSWSRKYESGWAPRV
jgi:predicted dehydrogenase